MSKVAARSDVGLAAIVTIILIAVRPWLADDYFDGNWVMVVALIVSIVAYAPAHLARGICSGIGRFRAYAVVMGADGSVRDHPVPGPRRDRDRGGRAGTAWPSRSRR